MKIEKRVGLEAISFDVPSIYLDLADLAKARGVAPEKFVRGLGQREMAIAPPGVDTVVLAVGAGRRLLDTYGVDPESIGLVVVGTETSVDQSKPVSVYVHEFLGLSPRCRAFETKHACYAAMAGLQMAMDWILSGRADGRKALVIASDIARYGVRTPGEPTQGAGAVALLISDTPRLVEFETARQGYFTKQVMDFWRPNYSKEAFADGHYSIECYLDALVHSYEMYAPREAEYFASLAGCLYHSPFPKMAQKAHLRLIEHVRGGRLEPETAAFTEALEDFNRRVAPHLEPNARVGNIYTGSLFLSLLAFLEEAQEGGRVSLFSYGSGSIGEFMTARVVEGCASLAKRKPYRAYLDSRTRIDVSQYEEIQDSWARLGENGSFGGSQREWPSSHPLAFEGIKDHQRRYQPKTLG